MESVIQYRVRRMRRARYSCYVGLATQWLDFFLCILMFHSKRGMTLMYIVILIPQHLCHKLCMNLVFLIRFVYMYMSLVEFFLLKC